MDIITRDFIPVCLEWILHSSSLLSHSRAGPNDEWNVYLKHVAQKPKKVEIKYTLRREHNFFLLLYGITTCALFVRKSILLLLVECF